MELFIAGGCSEHGRNCFFVQGDHLSFIVDAGMMKEKPEMPFPELTGEMIRSAKYLFITHCHADHSGAVKWLYDRGFQGEVIASEETFQWSKYPMKGRTLESIGVPDKKCKISKHLTLIWGRSGHCIGSVWYLFRLDGRKILFSGDYEEKSYAYHCDKIRDRKADIAVLDCAYGTESEDAAIHRREIEAGLDELIAKKKPILFPIPSHGRGLDLIRLLSERHVRVYLPDALVNESLESSDPKFWLKRKYRSAFEDLDLRSLDQLEDELVKMDGEMRFKRRRRAIGILVQDSQLYHEENQELADAVIRSGGRVVLTGKQDPSSAARALLDADHADFWRISVHENIAEMKRLMGKNRFRFVVPYHCRQALSFSEKNILVVKPGDIIKF